MLIALESFRRPKLTSGKLGLWRCKRKELRQAHVESWNGNFAVALSASCMMCSLWGAVFAGPLSYITAGETSEHRNDGILPIAFALSLTFHWAHIESALNRRTDSQVREQAEPICLLSWIWLVRFVPRTPSVPLLDHLLEVPGSQ